MEEGNDIRSDGAEAHEWAYPYAEGDSYLERVIISFRRIPIAMQLLLLRCYRIHIGTHSTCQKAIHRAFARGAAHRGDTCSAAVYGLGGRSLAHEMRHSPVKAPAG